MLSVNQEKCVGCGLCVQECYFGAIEVSNNKAVPHYDRCFKCGHCIAVCPQNCVVLDDYPAEDIQTYIPEKFDISPELLLNFVKFRRTNRNFLPKEVDDSIIRKLIEIGRFTQTGGNRQDVSYVVIKSQREEFRRLVIERLVELSNVYKTSEDPLLKRYALLWKMFGIAYKKDPVGTDKLFFKAPLILLITSPSPVNAALAAANISNMIDATPGLGTCFSGFAVRAATNNDTIKKFLQLPPQHEVVACLLVGYTNSKFQRTVQRKPAEITWM